MKLLIKPLVLFLCVMISASVDVYALTSRVTAESSDFIVQAPSGRSDGFLGSDVTICKDDTVRLEAPLALSYVWNTGQTTRFIQVNPAATSIFWVRIMNLQGQIESDTITVIVNPLPVVIIQPAYTELLPGEAVLLSASGASTYTWSTGETAAQLFVEPNLPENHYIVTGTTLAGCSSTATALVDVKYSTTASFTYSPSCIGDSTHFTAKILTNDTIQLIEWDLDGDLIFDDGQGNEAVFLLEQAGEWLAGIKVSTKYSSVAHIVYLPVIIGDVPVVNFSYGTTCLQSEVSFEGRATLSFGEIEQWSWDFGQGDVATTPDPKITYSQSGQYVVELNVVTTSGCEAGVSRTLTISPKPTLTVGLADGSPINQLPLVMYRNDTILLKANGIYDSIIWNQQVKNSLLQVVRPGNYSAVSYRNGCSSQQVTVGVVMSEFPYDPNLKIQNFLTPNGDGYNDVWEISMLNALRPAKVRIYTRSGLTVLDTGDYQNDWKGQYNNNPLPEGSYFYIIEGVGGEVFKGTITLMR